MILLRRYIYTGPIIVNPILTMNDVIHVVLLVQRPKETLHKSAFCVLDVRPV